MAVKTISKNGRRVAAESKGKAPKKSGPTRRGRPPKSAAGKSAPAADAKSPAASSASTPPSKPAPARPISKPTLTKPKAAFTAFPSKICAMLAQIRVNRQNAQNEERSMVKRRKQLDQWFEKNGDPGESCEKKNPTPEDLSLHAERRETYHLQTAEYKRTNDAIKSARTVQNWLAEKADSVVDMGMDPKLSDDFVDDAIDELIKQAPEMPLFSIAKEPTEAEPGSEHVDKHDGTIEPIDGPKIGGQYYVSDPNDPTAWAIVRVDGRKAGSVYFTTIQKTSKAWKGEPQIDFDEVDWRADDTAVSYLDRPVEHLTTLERHGSQIVSDAAVRCLRNAEISTIRQIGKLSGVHGLSVTDCEEITQAIEILQKRDQAERESAAA
jgi:hypothetical protein